jgi:hypothetical protein
MINQLLLWFALLPIGLGVAIWYFLRGQDTRYTGPRSIYFGAAFAFVGVLISAGAFYGSSAAATADTEIWNGQVTGKDREHGTYEQPYSCNCRTVTTGSGNNQTSTTVCDTCYETHYTVKWTCNSTIGGFTIDSKDSTSSSVYRSADPSFYVQAQPGDPAAKTHTYTNYVQAVPESLFKPSPAALKAKFAGLVPAYPDQIFNFYNINRFLTPGYSTPDAAAWNRDISLMLRELGPKKQVNLIVVVAKTADMDYEYALRDAWEGVNKNDVVVLIGSAAWPKIDYVRVLSWTKKEIFKIELRDSIQALNTIQREPILNLISAQINKNFERRHMSEFKYLEAEIDPPTWLLILLAVSLILSAGGIAAAELGMFAKKKSRFGRY